MTKRPTPLNIEQAVRRALLAMADRLDSGPRDILSAPLTAGGREILARAVTGGIQPVHRIVLARAPRIPVDKPTTRGRYARVLRQIAGAR